MAEDARAPLPAGLVAGQKRRRAEQLVAECDWYVVEPARFAYLATGDVSLDDLERLALAEPMALFVCVRVAKGPEEVLSSSRFVTRRLRLAARLRPARSPRQRWVARGARVAVLPEKGVVWVDRERLFRRSEHVSLPWTDPPVSLPVVRVPEVRAAMRQVVRTPAGSASRARGRRPRRR